MTIRELIANLSLVDDDVMDYEVWCTVVSQLNKDVRLTARTKLKEIPENVNVDEKRIYLKFRGE